VAAEIVLVSPLEGWCASLAEAPDPVFSEAMLGDGLAIDPTSQVLHAPMDASVVSVHAARHAVTLRTSDGLELLLHVGLETVGLAGEGFEALVKDGQSVRQGEPLIRFDLDRLARGARSLITPVVVTSEGFEIIERFTSRFVQVGEPILRLRHTGAAASVPTTSAAEVSRAVRVPLAHGLHARPAARLGALAKDYDAEAWIVRSGGQRASVRSAVAIMALGVRQGDEVQIVAAGHQAQALVDALVEMIAGGMGEARPFQPAPASPNPAPAQADGRLRGVTASPGLAIGPAAHLRRTEIAVAEAGQGAARETQALAGALTEIRSEIDQALAVETQATRKAILAAHAAFAEDSELLAEAERLIGQGKSAGFAFRAAARRFADALRALGDPRMAERVDDLLDLERRVLLALSGETDAAPPLARGAILLADELLPSQLMGLDPSTIGGLCTARGGPTSHVAILAASMGLPAVVAAGAGVLSIPDGAPLILDADAAVLSVSPDAQALEAAQLRLAERAGRRAAAQASAGQAAQTRDGASVPVLANLGAVSEAAAAVAAGADGCGLLRTEFLFLGRETAPDEDEQAQAYREILEGLAGRPLVIRLLDVGGDKPAPSIPQAAEENPALGVRGVRLLLRRPQILTTQLRAILRAADAGPCSIMVPMVARLAELRAVRAALTEAAGQFGVVPPALGVMIETPAAAMIAAQLAAEADFFSIGTNDLTQYGLAMDRGNPELAAEVDGLDPAIIALIGRTCEAAAARGRPVSVCGGLAADPAAIPILLGLGVSRLSMVASAVAEAKAQVRGLSLDACRALARQAHDQPDAEAVRSLAEPFRNGAA
jgi:phosphocarrier protein FPr/phosphocarrier protein